VQAFAMVLPQNKASPEMLCGTNTARAPAGTRSANEVDKGSASMVRIYVSSIGFFTG
jgi:hypothetical protein